MEPVPTPTPVAIIGIGCLFPKADNLAQFWANIKSRVDAITDVPPSHWRPDDYFNVDPKAPDQTYARRGGFLNPVDFPPLEYGIAPNALEATDTSQLLGMVVARHALADAGYGPERAFNRDRVSVILGVTGTLELVIPLGARLGHPIWRRALKEAGVADEVANDVVERIAESYVGWQENSFPGLLGNVVAGRIANRLDLGGTNCVVDAACASSLSAVHLAMLELQAGRADMVLTGGVDTFNDIFMYMCFSKTPALSPTGNAKPFDINGDGTILGEGLGMLVLKRLADAEGDGDRIYAVIRGLGSSSDGKGNAIYAPKAAGQVKALKEAYKQAGVTPDTIELVEAHGTGTKAGDATEVTALSEVYEGARKSKQPDARHDQEAGRWCAVGSVKSQIGHTKAAAGAAGLIKTALALHRKVLPPTLKVNQPLEQFAADGSPFYVNTEQRPWLPGRRHPRRAGVSSFGFGGSNFHCVLEEYRPQKDAIDWDGSVEIVALSAKSVAELNQALEGLAGHQHWIQWRQAAQKSRRTFNAAAPYRLVFVVERDKSDRTRQVAAARSLVEKHSSKRAANSPDGIYFGQGSPAGSLAVIFPGQGSQYAGMLRDLACQFPMALATLAEAENIFGGSLSDSIYPKTTFTEAERQRNEEQLRATDIAQPAIGAVSLAGWRIVNDFGVAADAFAGHSFGELTALCAAGRLDAAAFFALAKLRGQLMAGANGDRGAMLAVRAPLADVEQLLAREQLDLVIANKNAPAQAVLSGSTAAIEKAAALFQQRQTQCHRLPVAAAFHSSLVADVREPFLAALQSVAFSVARQRVYANTTASEYPADPDAARRLLAEQLARPVEFVHEIIAMYDSGARTFLEVGPGNKMTGLVRAILDGKEFEAIALDASAGQRSGVADLARCLAQLAASGYAVKLDRWEDNAPEPAAPEDNKPTLTIPIGGANYMKPRATKPPQQREPQPRWEAAITSAAAPLNGDKPQAARPLPTPTPAPPAAPTPARVVQTPAQTNQGSPLVDPSVTGQAFRATQESLIALQKLSEQTAQLHKQFLEGQDRAQQTFRVLLEQQQQLFGIAAGANTAPVSDHRAIEAVRRPSPAPAAVLAEPLKPAPIVTQEPPVAIVTPPRPPDKPQTPAQANDSLAAILLGVVSAKTGYPAEMLDLNMALDADLGIDSIKRVEIFSVLQEKIPNAPSIKPEHLGTLHTLRDVVAFLGASVPASNGHAERQAAVNGRQSAVRDTLLAVVAEKTGYPVEMLNLDMAMDADLGIDSIKRVEILSALQEKLPNAPVVKPEHLGTLHTLQQVVAFLDAGGAPANGRAAPPASDGPALPAMPAPAVRTGASDEEQIHCALVEVVADKTGYPPEMLDLDMALDTDLGIDSIKRVEILSALQEKLPNAPAVKPEQLGTLHTLRQVAEFLAGPKREPAAMPAVAAKANGEIRNGRNGAEFPASINKQESRPCAQALQRLVLTRIPLESAADENALHLPAGSDIWITDDGSGLSQLLVARFDGLGFRPRLLAMKDALALPNPQLLGGLVLIAPLGTLPAAFLLDSLKLVQHAAGGLKNSAANGGALLATVARLDGCFGLANLDPSADPIAGGLAGLAKTAACEWPEVHCRALDLAAQFADTDEAATAVADALLHHTETEIGVSADGLGTLQSVAVPLAEGGDSAPFEPGEVIVVTGGARGVTAEVAAALARAFQPTLVLLGRSPAPSAEPPWLESAADENAIKKAIIAEVNGQATPKVIAERVRTVMANREIARNMARMQAAGATVHYRIVDVRSAEAMRETIRAIQSELGPIRGLVHGAGVLADRRITDKTEEQFQLVYETKIAGLRAALEELPEEELRAVVLFSSSTARFGRAGQVDYAMANEVLNKLAQREARRRPRCRVLSLNWGPWDGGMVTPALKQLFESEGVGIIPLEAGADYVVRELCAAGNKAVEIVLLGERAKSPSMTQTSASPTGSLSLVAERQIDVQSVPVLAAHVLDGRAVLPMALMIEWLAHAAAHGNPGLAFHGFDNLRVLKGMQLGAGESRTLRLYASKAGKRDGFFVAPVELRSVADGKERLHARAEILLAARLPSAKPSMPPVSGQALDESQAAIYDRYLFHGQALRGIKQIGALSADGVAAAVAAAPAPAAWLGQPLRSSWFADPLALDCSFQLMIVWSWEQRGAASLPCGAGRYRQYRRSFPRGPVNVRIAIAKDLGQRVLATIEFLDQQDELIARLDDYECVIDPSLRSAFQRNQLPAGQVAISS